MELAMKTGYVNLMKLVYTLQILGLIKAMETIILKLVYFKMGLLVVLKCMPILTMAIGKNRFY